LYAHWDIDERKKNKDILSIGLRSKEDDSRAPILFLFAIQADGIDESEIALPQTRLVSFIKELHEQTRHSQKGQGPLDFKRSFYADDAEFIFLTREDRIEGSAFTATERQLHVHELIAAGLYYSNDGAFSKWMHRFREHDIGSHIDEQLGL
jgi:hypothetical protein